MFCRKSASCTHVYGLLHALVAMSPSFPFHSVTDPSTSEPEEEALPITSYACLWKPPHKRKESTLQMSEATFHKPVYGREKRRSSKPLEEFDPRPPEYKNTAQGRLTEFLGKVRGKVLCVSLMFNSASQYWQDETQTGSGEPLLPKLLSKEELQTRVEEFKKSLHVSAFKLRQFEQNTRDHSQSALRFSVHRYRITASYFGAIHRRLPTTSSQSLVLQILEGKQFQTLATEWGKKHEELALKQYEEYEHASGHENLYAC